MQNGFKIIGLDIHIIAPPEMWEQYIDRACKDRAPKIVGRYPVGTYFWCRPLESTSVSDHPARSTLPARPAQCDHPAWTDAA